MHNCEVTNKPSPADKPGRKRYNMKKEKFQMRISEETREDLDRIAKHYNLSASATIDMLIAKEKRLIDKQRKEDEEK